MDKKVLFSKKTNDFIVLMLGLAFVLIYCTSVLLYYLTAQTMEHFYIKILILFLVYLFLYFCCIYMVTSRVKELFAPLDNLYCMLTKDEGDIEGDVKDFEQLVKEIKGEINTKKNLEKTLDEARTNLDDMSRISDEQNVLLAEGIKRCNRRLNEARRELDHIKSDNANAVLLCDELGPISASIRNRKLSLDSEKDEVTANIRTSILSVSDVKTELAGLVESFDLLVDMLNDAANNLDLMFSDVQALTSASAQTNLFVLTAKLEVSRGTSFSMAVTNALDDLDSMTKDIIDKADGFSMFIIKTKNSVNLALDQAVHCREQITSEDLGFAHALDTLNITGSQIGEIIEYVGSVNDGVSRIVDGLNQINAYGHNINKAREKSQLALADLKSVLAGDK